MLTERITYACAQKVYPNSKGLQEFIHASFDLDHSKFRMIGKGSSNGIDSNYFRRTEELERQMKAIREQFQIQDAEVVFCFVGRLVKDKGLIELVNAFQRLTFSSRLMLVGSFEEHLDPLPEEVMRFLRKDSRVILTGFQQDVRPWMMASDVFVFPSYREGFPNVVMQAACLELPSIVSDINGCTEIVQQGETGMIVPLKNSDALLEAMVRIKGDEAARKKWLHVRVNLWWQTLNAVMFGVSC
jgi:Glycosyltransferase